MRRGGAYTTFHFSNVPVQKVGVLPDGTVRWSGNITFEDHEVYIATFDVPQLLVQDLASALCIDARLLAPGPDVKKHILTQPRAFQLECMLGGIDGCSADAFVPFWVRKLAVQDIESKSPVKLN
jgi:hypothetical protein